MVRYWPIPMKDKNWRLAAVAILTSISGTYYYQLKREKANLLEKTRPLNLT